MVRFVILGLITILATSSTSFAAEAHLRHEDLTTPEEKDQERQDFPMPKAGCFDIEKGIKCKGGFSMEKGVAGKACKGGMNGKYCFKMSAQDISESIAQELHGQTQEAFAKEEAFMAGEEEMKELAVFDDAKYLEGLEDGFSKSVTFGGFIKGKWGCEVSFEKKGGNFTKSSKCGFKVKQGMGLSPDSDDDNEESGEMTFFVDY